MRADMSTILSYSNTHECAATAIAQSQGRIRLSRHSADIGVGRQIHGAPCCTLIVSSVVVHVRW